MIVAVLLVVALAYDAAVLHDYTANQRIRTYPSQSVGGQLQATPHIHYINVVLCHFSTAKLHIFREMTKIYFVSSRKVRNFAPDFTKESRSVMRLATENVRNFQCNASGYNGFTCIAWAVYYIFITRFSHDPQSKSGIRYHAFVIGYLLNGVRFSV